MKSETVLLGTLNNEQNFSRIPKSALSQLIDASASITRVMSAHDANGPVAPGFAP
jgi:hypothetical protein